MRPPRVPRPRAPLCCRAAARDPPAEADPRYRRAPLGAAHAWKARVRFAQELATGPARIDAVNAALAAAAEDDALATDAAVPLPAAPFAARVDGLARDVAAALDREGVARDGEEALAVVARAVAGWPLKVVAATSLPPASILDCPGVYESPVYLHADALIRRSATPAVAAILLAAVAGRLLASGALAVAPRVSWRGLPDGALPTLTPLLKLTSGGGVRADGSALVAFDAVSALADADARLLRAFWPFRWATASPLADPLDADGGFELAAEALTAPADEGRSALDAVAAAAAHRLARGIFTSPGAGDVRRALSAARRAVLLSEVGATLSGEAGGGAAGAASRRANLGLLLLASGGPPAAAAVELDTWLASAAAAAAPASRRAAARALAAAAAARAGAAPRPPPHTLATALAEPEPVPDENARVPLVW